jgi:uncharacterized protein
MADNATTGVREARPRIFIGGSEDLSLAGGLLNLLIAEDTTGLYRCEATFSNLGSKDNKIGFLYFDRRTLDFSKVFQVKIGDDVIFDGKIMGLEAKFPEGQPPEIVVLAEDRFQDLRMTRRTRTFADSSDEDVFKKIANDHGLSSSINATGPTYKVLAQVNQSDLAFMRERARSIDAELWMDGNKLNIKRRGDRSRVTLQMTHGNELRDFSVLADLARQRTSVAVNGWDVASKAALKYEAGESVISGELNGETSGVSILKSAFGERKEALAHTVPLNSQEARFEAEAFFKMCARRFLLGRGIAEPNALLRVGAYVDLQGLGPLFNGKYYLSGVTHLFDVRKGMRTEFCAERPSIGRAQ